MKPVKLGVFLSLFGSLIKDASIDPKPNFRHVYETAKIAEYFNFYAVWATDHLLNPKLSINAPALESWTILSALASVTKKIRLGHAVMCAAFRNPVIVAKMVGTIDDICEGRFILGLGAGNFEPEFKAFGFPFDTHAKLIERAEEQLILFKRLWTESQVSFTGKNIQVVNCTVEPKPIQKPYPPIFWGGTSEASLRVAAKHGDGWFMKDSSVEDVKTNIASIQRFLNGRKIEYGMGVMLILGETDKSAYEKLLKFVNGDEEFANQIVDTGLVGAPQTVAEKLHQYLDAGLNHVMIKPAPTLSGLIDFGEKVMPLL
jgi:alkanesulfonate monooxygenase SsuD/methylene tetrahydromethanopterin reductase-like flavin-dependent oxidoreductase (luciferase family)